MCLATVYLEEDGQREEVMRDVAWIVPESGGLELIPFLGESRLFQARIKSIDLVNNSIVLERMAADATRSGFDGQSADRGTDRARSICRGRMGSVCRVLVQARTAKDCDL